MASNIYAVDDLVNLVRSSLPLPAPLPPIVQGTAAEWICKQAEWCSSFLDKPHSLEQVSDPWAYCTDSQLCVVYAAEGAMSFLFRSADGSRYCWEFASSLSHACNVLQSETQEIDRMVQQYRLANPFRNMALQRFTEVVRLAAVMERLRFCPIVGNVTRTETFLKWAIEALKSGQNGFIEDGVLYASLH